MVARIREGDPDAWEELVREFGPLVLATARETGLAECDCEEVFQSTWVSLHRQLEHLRRPRGLVAWILVTARRLAWQLQEQARNRRRWEERADGRGEDPAEDPVAAAMDLELRQVVHEAVEELPPRCRRLIEYLYLRQEANSYDAVARDMGVPRGAVGPMRLRCLAHLSDILGRRGLPVPAPKNEG